MFNHLDQELTKKDLKGISFDENSNDKIALNIYKPENFPDLKKVQRFKQNSKVYCKSVKEYVQIKSFNAESKKYTVRLMKQEVVKEENANIETTEDDLTEWI